MLKNSIIATVVALVLSACSAETQQKTYSLDGSVDALRDGKAYLYVLLPEYQKLMLLDSADVRHGGFRFSGTVDEPMEAFVRLKGDTAAYCFVLTNNRLTMTIEDGTYSVQGSPSNRALSQLLADRYAFEKRRESLQAAYKKQSADSTLTKVVEDSLMTAYHQAGVEYRRLLLECLTKKVPGYPLMGRVALRMFGGEMLQCEIDSVSLLMKNPR